MGGGLSCCTGEHKKGGRKMKLAISLLINCFLTTVLSFVLFVEFAQYDKVFYLVCVMVLFAAIFAIMALDEFIKCSRNKPIP